MRITPPRTGFAVTGVLAIVALTLAVTAALLVYTLGQGTAPGDAAGQVTVADQATGRQPAAEPAGPADCAPGRRLLGGGVPEGVGARPDGCRAGPTTDVHGRVGRGTGLIE